MKTIKYAVGLALISMASLTASAQLTYNVTVPSSAQPIPYAPEGSSLSSLTIADAPGDFTIGSLSLSLEITDAAKFTYSGDFFATLIHVLPGGDINTASTAVLLNRVGKDVIHVQGYFDTGGLSITLQDSASTDVHTYQNEVNPNGGRVTGTFQPDGRIQPSTSVTTADVRNNMLSVFNGQTLNGTWILNVSDYNNSSGNYGLVTNWSLTAVPEPSQYAMLAGLGLIGFAAYRRFSLKAC